jgi:hypothetical protein
LDGSELDLFGALRVPALLARANSLQPIQSNPDDYGWYGWASGCFIILREDAKGRSVPHEERHVWQQMIFGILAPILYVLASIFIFFFRKALHSYYDNPFEVDARRFAGQRIKIPRDAWADPQDRWAWW